MARTLLSALTALSAVLCAAPVGAQERVAANEVAVVTGRVERIDSFSRGLTIKTADGYDHVVYVGRELEVFSEIKTGDNVAVRVVESVIVEAKPGARLTGVQDTTAAAKKAPEAAQGDVLQQLKAVVTIVSIDQPRQMVVYKGGDNRPVQRQVRDPRLLDGLNAGDVVEITFTRARAIDLQRQP